MKNKKILIPLILILLAVIIVGIITYPKKKEPEVIKIGAILPLTGDAAQWGIPPRRGAELAIKKINEANFLNFKLDLIVEDGKCSPKEAVSAFNKIITVDKVRLVMGEVCSGATLAIAPIAEKNGILLISPASTNPTISEAGDYIFRVIPSDALRGKVFAEYVFNKGYRRVGIIYINNEGGKGNRDSFKERFENLGGQIVIEETYKPGSTDMRAQLTKIKSISPEVVIAVSYPSDTYILMKQAKELELNIPLYFQTEAVEDSNVLREAGNAAEGVIYILPAPAEGEKTDEFIQEYEKVYGIKPELFAAEGYDIIWLIANAIKDTGKTDPKSIKDYLYKVKNYQGASGIITFDENGDVLKPMAIKTIKDGKPTLIELVKNNNF